MNDQKLPYSQFIIRNLVTDFFLENKDLFRNPYGHINQHDYFKYFEEKLGKKPIHMGFPGYFKAKLLDKYKDRIVCYEFEPPSNQNPSGYSGFLFQIDEENHLQMTIFPKVTNEEKGEGLIMLGCYIISYGENNFPNFLEENRHLYEDNCFDTAHKSLGLNKSPLMGGFQP